MLSVLLLAFLAEGPAAAQTSVSLREAIRLSEQNSEAVKSARHDSSAAALSYDAAKALRFPALSLSATSFHINKLQSIDIPPISREIGVKDNYQADLRLSLPLFTGGQIANRVGMQKETALALSQSVQVERLKNAYVTRRACLELMIADTMLKSAQASSSRIEIIRGDVQNLYASGIADSVDILDAELAFHQASQTVAQKKTVRNNVSASLARLIGVNSDDELTLTEPVPIPVLTELEGPVSGLDQMDRPELKVLNHRIGAAQRLIGLERAAGFPFLTGYTGYSVGKPNRDQFNQTWNDNFTVGISLTWEFNLGGRFIRSAQAAREEVFSARFAKRELEESLILGAKVSWENMRQAFDDFAASQTEYDIAKRKFALAKEKREAGQISVNRLLELEAELTATEQLHFASMLGCYLCQADYLYAIGSSRIYGGL